MLSHRLDEVSELRLMQPWHAEELFALTEANRARLAPWLRSALAVGSLDEQRSRIQEWLERFAKGEGIQRESFYIHGKFRDTCVYSLLAREFSPRD